MMTTAHPQSLSASTFPSQRPRSSFPLVDRATALELRRTTKSAIRDRRSSKSSVNLTCPLTICTMDSVVIVSTQGSITGRGKRLSWSQIKLDLSWISAAVVALSVTLALAIPLELLGQHG